jgi:hypothetical protein
VILTRQRSGEAGIGEDLMTAWWLILYYPTIFALLALGARLDKRYPAGSIQRNRADIALGCAFLALPGLPLIIAVSIIMRNPNDPTVLLIEAIVAFNVVLVVFFGGLMLFAKSTGAPTSSRREAADGSSEPPNQPAQDKTHQ